MSLADVNAYLFYELGFDDVADESAVTDNWPFRLVAAGDAAGRTVYEIEWDGERHFVLEDPLTVTPTAGMTVADLAIQDAGLAWIGARDPIDLETASIGYDDIPPGPERRAALEALADGAPVLEGLFLRVTGEYIALAGDVVVGTSLPPTPAPFPNASAYRRLGYVIGCRTQRFRPRLDT